MAAPRTTYFSLPRELRDKIMTYALQPGDIYLPSNSASKMTNSGVQLLATCRQAYAEGYELYYRGNTFHLGPCSFTGMKQILEAYQPKHIAIVPRLTIECSIKDVSSEHIEEMKKTAEAKITARKLEFTAILRCMDTSPYTRDEQESPYESPAINDLLERKLQDQYAEVIGKAIGKIWRDKARWLQEHLQGGSNLRVIVKPRVKGGGLEITSGKGFGGLFIELGTNCESGTYVSETIFLGIVQLKKQVRQAELAAQLTRMEL